MPNENPTRVWRITLPGGATTTLQMSQHYRDAHYPDAVEVSTAAEVDPAADSEPAAEVKPANKAKKPRTK